MTVRQSKSGRIATAFVLAATFTTFLIQPTKAASATTDPPAVFDRARIIHVKGKQYFPGQWQENGQPVPPVEIDTWIDKRNGCTRETHAGTSQRSQMSSQTGFTTTTTVTTTETICDSTYLMTLNHTAKTATFSRVSAYYRDLAAQRLSHKVWTQLCGQAALLESFPKAGQETVNDVTCNIWQLDATHTLGDGSGSPRAGGGMVGPGSRGPRGGFPGPPGYTTRSKFWLAADSGRPVRAQALSRTQDGRWDLQSDYSTIECNGEVPPGTFATEPPAGYATRNSKATAPPAELRRGLMNFNANGRNVEFGVLVAFTLSDGSVVAGWQSRGGQDGASQEPLFANLTFGGPLPKLPVEIYGLRPAGHPSAPAYTGHHLAYTRKADRFTEWSLYIPAGTPPPLVKQAGYDALYRFHLDAKPNALFGLNVEYGVPIQTAEDFDKWVRGAMAELSDGGTPPVGTTYQKVCDVARQVRVSIKP